MQEYSPNGLPTAAGAFAGFPTKDFIISVLIRRVEKLEEAVVELKNKEGTCSCGKCST